ncbi:CDP-alcohol phosphatidyltransferase family protein [Demequina sp. TTPB684]|uniref:CDP-alcohol phosphatidyltransferase family protein n=1 Tax=unclassified Demequina TaxID=2620311 RepID=UPI001CF57F6B|nr:MULTISPECIES: CDP-alcohol phosphatidyltransferase family protein [unclassified Demequina]MCB2412998.1 CDP-alcohol phosphatidyltransferase family protein [Demequina sp. TTPB684]UPU87067.1 CDP-alcohol phosphatidyltransferase family protein [Demequina sp. TMPB413]
MPIVMPSLTGPDIVTASRIPLAFALAAVAPARGATLWIFAIGCATDVIDGWWARRAGIESARGARLDSVADAVFFVAATYAVIVTVELTIVPAAAAAIAFVALTRIANMAITKRRFGRFNVMHTDLNRATGAALALAAGVGLATGALSTPAVLAVTAFAGLASVEELVLVSRAGTYDPDHRGVVRETLARVVR